MAFEPALTRFESENAARFQTLHIDIDHKDHPDDRKYEHLLRDGGGWAIPYTVLVDAEGKPCVQWVGTIPYEQLVQDATPVLGTPQETP